MSIEIIEEILQKPMLNGKDKKILESYEPNKGVNRLYSFFTPIWLCEVMYKLAIRHGFDPKSGKILEPACGTGNFLSVLDHPENCTAFELDPLNAAIAKKRVPNTKMIHNDYFETAFLAPPRFTRLLKQDKKGAKSKIPNDNESTWLIDEPFDLVIGNPPYGKYQNLYSSQFKGLQIKQLEVFFMYQSLRLIKKGGLLVFITGSNFLRSDTYNKEKKLLSKLASFVDGYRMPKVFKNTSVPTDIIILKRS